MVYKISIYTLVQEVTFRRILTAIRHSFSIHTSYKKGLK